MYYMTFVEDCDKYRVKLSLWPNKDGKIYFQMGPDDEDDPIVIQGMSLDVADCKVLVNEITSIIQDIERIQPEGTLPLWAEKEKEEKKKLFQKPND